MIYGFVFAIVQVFHLLYRILPLADTKIGSIDKVKYCVMQNNHLGKSNLQNVCEKQKNSSVSITSKIAMVRNFEVQGVHGMEQKTLKEIEDKELFVCNLSFHPFSHVLCLFVKQTLSIRIQKQKART
jgi:hypothetical protein